MQNHLDRCENQILRTDFGIESALGFAENNTLLPGRSFAQGVAPMLTRLICCCVVSLSALLPIGTARTVNAEEPEPRPLGKPLIRAWFPTTLLEDRQAMLNEINQESSEDPDKTQPVEAHSNQTGPQPVRHEGLLVYFDPIGDKDPNISRTRFPYHRVLNPIRFMAVKDREEFEQIVRQRTGMDQEGATGVLKEKEGAFEFSPNIQWLVNDGWLLPGYLQRVSKFWRYRDGYMFFCDDENLLKMELPESETLERRGRAKERDLFVQLDLDALAPKQKNRIWSAMRKRLEKVLQQHDEEDQIAYAFRKAWGELQLNLIQAVTNDLHSIRFGVDFASSEQPAEITLDLIARPGVDLGKHLGKSSVGSRQMSAMIEEPAILTLAAGWELPLHFRHVLEKSIALVNKELLTRAGFHADTFIATDDLTTALQESLEGAREFAVKLSRSEQGFTVYGGIRLSEARRVSNSLEYLLNSLTSTAHTGVTRSRDTSGRSYLSYRPSHLSGFLAQTAREQFPAEAHLTVEGSTLWFSFGPPDSLDVLSQALDRTEQIAIHSGRMRFPLMLLDVELDLLLVDDEETTGFDRVPQLALQNLSEQIPKHNGLGTQNYVKVFNSPSDLPDTTEVPIPEIKDPAPIKFSNQPEEIELPQLKSPTIDPPTRERPDSDPHEQYIKDLSNAQEDLLASRWTISGDWSDYSVTVTSAFNAIDFKKFLKPNQSRIRAEIKSDPKRLRLKLTAGLGVIKHVVHQSQQGSPLSGVIWLLDDNNANHEIDLKFTIPSPQTDPESFSRE